MALQPLTVGTAGHIDHGKTALVRALTGRDTDRLAEERRRGMSIELGFAEIDLGERRLSLVDVPGHERFVRTMIAGASGIDMFLLVVAADDGPMPQTHEHLAVLQALGIEHGVVALTKIDLVDEETRQLAAASAAALIPEAPLVEASTQTGEGLDALRGALNEVAETAEPGRRSSLGRIWRYKDERREAAGEPVLHVDRAFTVAGHGTVVTGTLWSGRLERGQRVRVLPSGREARVRSIEVHDRPLDVAESHQRVAINLGGVDRDQVERGDVIATEAAGVIPTYRLDVDLLSGGATILAEPRVQVHLGTRDSAARLVDLGDGGVQLRLERPLLARPRDRVVVRRIAPPDTLGGGIVRDASPPRHGPGWEPPEPEAKSAPASPPLDDEPSPFALRLLAELEQDGSRPRGAAKLAEDLGAERREVEKAFGELAAAGAAVRAKADVVYAAAAYEKLARLILALAERDGAATIASVRDALGLSRKYAQALLEQLDAEKRLRRDGDRHLPRAGPARNKLGHTWGGRGLVAHPAFKAGRAVQPTAWKVRFLRRLASTPSSGGAELGFAVMQVRVLELDPDLGSDIPAERLPQADRACRAETLDVRTGTWDPEAGSAAAEDGYGLLVLSGLFCRRVVQGQRYGAELLGPGDLLRPWDRIGEWSSIPVESTWLVIEDARLAVLDREFAGRCAPFPEIGVALIRRGLMRSRYLAIMFAIVGERRVETRLTMLFWHLADRFGRMRGDWIEVPVPLTHRILSELVAARRPSVSTALTKLQEQGVLLRTAEGWQLHRDSRRSDS